MMVRENVWDYPRLPRVEAVKAAVRIDFASETIAETRDALRVLETTHPPVYYLPRGCFTCDLVASARRGSLCEWKGEASYWTIRAGAHEAKDCAWSYADPTSPFAAIRDHFAVYPAAMDACFVDGERVTPQPGGFYGGWITSNLVGPFKGRRGRWGGEGGRRTLKAQRAVPGIVRGGADMIR